MLLTPRLASSIVGILLLTPSLGHAAPSADLIATMLPAIQTGTSDDDTIQQLSSAFAVEVDACTKGIRQVLFQKPECLRRVVSGAFTREENAAKKAGALPRVDEVEQAIVSRILKRVTDIASSGKPTIDESRGAAPTASATSIAQPPLAVYEANKKLIIAHRKGATLDTATVALLKKSYPRSMIDVGSITPEEYFAAEMDDTGLETVSSVLRDAMNVMYDSSGKLMLRPANYAAMEPKLMAARAAVAAAAQDYAGSLDPASGATLEVQQGKQQTLIAAQANLTALNAKSPVDQLTVDAAVAESNLEGAALELASGTGPFTPSPETAARLLGTIQTSTTMASNARTKLSTLVQERDMQPTDLTTYAINLMNFELYNLNHNNSQFAKMNLMLGDTIAAAWVGGDITSRTVSSLLLMPALQSTKQSLLLRIGTIAETFVLPPLMIYPPTQYAAILVSALQGAYAQVKASSKGQVVATQIIPSNQ